MQSDSKEIYRLTAVRTGKNEQIYKDIGNFIQKETAQALKKPKSLIIKLKGIGFWFLRKKRLEKIVSYYPPHYDLDGYNDFSSEAAFLNFVNKKEMYDIFRARLKDYEKYMKLKAEHKIKKDEFEKLQQAQKASSEASEDNSQEHSGSSSSVV